MGMNNIFSEEFISNEDMNALKYNNVMASEPKLFKIRRNCNKNHWNILLISSQIMEKEFNQYTIVVIRISAAKLATPRPVNSIQECPLPFLDHMSSHIHIHTCHVHMYSSIKRSLSNNNKKTSTTKHSYN